MGDNGSKDFRTHKKERERAFHEAISDGGVTPEGLILDVMRDKPFAIDEQGVRIEYTERQYQAAKDLLPYRLPRLNSIDAVSKNVGMTHEEWLQLVDTAEHGDNPEGTNDDD